MVGGAFLTCQVDKNLTDVNVSCSILTKDAQKIFVPLEYLADIKVYRNGVLKAVPITLLTSDNPFNFTFSEPLTADMTTLEVKVSITPDNVLLSSGVLSAAPLKPVRLAFADSFEIPTNVVPDYSYLPLKFFAAFNNWQISWLPSHTNLLNCPMQPLLEIQVSQGQTDMPASQEGKYHVELNSGCPDATQTTESNTMIVRTIPTTVGKWYELSFYYQGRTVGTNSLDSRLQVKLNGATILDQTQANQPLTWTRSAYRFQAKATTTPLSFADLGARSYCNCGVLLDNVRFDELQ